MKRVSEAVLKFQEDVGHHARKVYRNTITGLEHTDKRKNIISFFWKVIEVLAIQPT